MEMSSFVFVCVLLIKGDRMGFATSAGSVMCKDECVYSCRYCCCFNIILLTIGKTSVENKKRGGVILIKLRRDVKRNVTVSIFGELYEENHCVFPSF